MPTLTPIAHFHSPLTSKFGVPRQSGLAPNLSGHIVFTPDYRRAEALRGLEGFDWLWLIWGFSANEAKDGEPTRLTVRPPRLGGNERIGVFASRSPFRPNGLGLSCVHIQRVEMDTAVGPIIHVLGADLMDGTPIYDVKPYVAYTDSHPDARSGFVDSHDWHPLQVDIPDAVARQLSPTQEGALRQVLMLDPRPQYHDDPQRIYGMPFDGYDVRFRVEQGVCHVLNLVKPHFSD